MTRACILGCAGTALTPAEAAFFAEARPWGFILFRRNIDSSDQVRALISALRSAVGDPAAPVLVDQEGGRVRRLKAPPWRQYPPARAFIELTGDLSTATGLAWMGGRLMAEDLADLGVTIDCAPVADVPVPGGHDIIGDRAFADSPAAAAPLARAMAEGLLAGGVIPVVKHMPGHGRARVDSHLSLPIVDATRAELESWDLPPFQALADLPIAMTAHVVFTAIDPAGPCTTSATVIESLIRGTIGFDGLLISDDLSMKALTGGLDTRAAAALAAGCDLALHCNGDMAEMSAVVSAVGPLTGRGAERAHAALAWRRSPSPLDGAAVARFDAAFPREPAP